ncbi:MAG: imidazole glycerol phosphate synthase subunit HisH [Epsilonproteobacteria bacterium]|nr:MAG: imidazole glycerol phosphate synthase subunit HisH [Campylobacterota bacterium]
MIAIIDYNMGNLSSVKNACDKIGASSKIVSKPENLKDYDKIILPGVGAYKDAMEHLKEFGLDDAIKQFADTGKLVFGVCLGLQLLFDSSDEFCHTKGLGLIQGKVVAFDKSKFINTNLKVPQMGWNKITTNNNKLFENTQNPYLYFVHSYHIVCDNSCSIGETTYGYNFTSAVNYENIYGLQPHPEKSHNEGLQILKNFCNFN